MQPLPNARFTRVGVSLPFGNKASSMQIAAPSVFEIAFFSIYLRHKQPPGEIASMYAVIYSIKLRYWIWKS
jgi:hypothetical protein